MRGVGRKAESKNTQHIHTIHTIQAVGHLRSCLTALASASCNLLDMAVLEQQSSFNNCFFQGFSVNTEIKGGVGFLLKIPGGGSFSGERGGEGGWRLFAGEFGG